MREIALQVLVAVQNQSAFSDKLVESQAARHALDRRDFAFLNQLVRGTLRRRGTLDAVLDAHVHVGLASLPPWIQNALRLGAYQLCYLDRVPAHAAVAESVSLARKYGHPGTAGLVNSVLRRVSERPAAEHLGRLEEIRDPRERLAALTSHPTWILDRWLERYDEDEVRRLAEANNRIARVGLRVNRLRIEPEALRRRLESEGLRVTPGRWSPDTLWIEGEIDLRSLEPLRRGECTVQDESETLVGALLDAAPGGRALDLCAAPGGKTGHLAERMEDRGEIVAVEKQPSRVRALRENLERLRLRSVRVQEGDGRALRWNQPFDRVLIDAPCSGLGVLARRADARWRKKPELLARMPGVQRELLEAGARALAPSGAMVYSVCSFEPEETTELVEGFLSGHPELRLGGAAGRLPAEVVSGEGTMLCLPHVHGTDGAFAARFEKADT